ncbi:MAG: preprotein translocase subunit SecY [Thermofilum sp. ex4484_15]|nr:MAG: preprotein translocase subunit SecY [Thermofilum sp. ex4484_15]
MSLSEKVQPIFRVLPEIPKPGKRLSLGERLFWTGLVLVVYLVMSQIPLFGIPYLPRSAGSYLTVLRLITASRRGTLMELGIGPLVTSGLIWQLLVGSRIVKLDTSTPEGRATFTGLEKLFTIIFTIVEASAYILGGAYGHLSTNAALIVFAQLFLATALVMLMDEMLQKGWGVGSGVSLFIAAGVAQRIFWQLFSPITLRQTGNLPLGVLSALFVAIGNGISSGDWSALSTVAFRSFYPNLVGLATTVALFLLLLYLENVQVEIPVSMTKYGGIRSKIPLKFLYVSVIPVIIIGALYSNIFIFSQLIWARLHTQPNNWFYNNIFKYIANYNVTAYNEGRGFIPLPGTLVYYLTSPRGIRSIVQDPLRVVIYSVVFLVLSVLFSIAWVEAAGMDPWSQARQISKAGLQIPGFRGSPRAMAIVLERYIPALTILSGLVVGLIAVVGNLLNVLSSGMGLLLLVEILIQYHTIIAQERALEAYPLLRKLVKP